MKNVQTAIATMLLFIVAWGLSACGDPSITLSGNDFEPRITIQGYLYPDAEVSLVLTRNFPLQNETTIESVFDLLITEATVTLTDVARGVVYPLTYEARASLAYGYAGDDLVEGRT